MSPADILTTCGLVGAAIAFVVGLRQHARGMRWKRAEWVAQEMKALLSDIMVQHALQMIDWNAREIRFSNAAGELGPAVGITDQQIVRALQHHSNHNGFGEHGAAIRDCFDRLLDGLERFNAYQETGLIAVADLTPYLAYWAHRITSNGSPEKAEQIDKYIQGYGFHGARKLLHAIRNVTPGLSSPA